MFYVTFNVLKDYFIQIYGKNINILLKVKTVIYTSPKKIELKALLKID